jgi:hypothetical protein
MSTEFVLFEDSDITVEIVESSAKWSLNLCGYHTVDYGDSPGETYIEGPQHMTAEEALRMAATIIYAVWCHKPDQATAMVARMNKDILSEERQ